MGWDCGAGSMAGGGGRWEAEIGDRRELMLFYGGLGKVEGDGGRRV